MQFVNAAQLNNKYKKPKKKHRGKVINFLASGFYTYLFMYVKLVAVHVQCVPKVQDRLWLEKWDITKLQTTSMSIINCKQYMYICIITSPSAWNFTHSQSCFEEPSKLFVSSTLFQRTYVCLSLGTFETGTAVAKRTVYAKYLPNCLNIWT